MIITQTRQRKFIHLFTLAISIVSAGFLFSAEDAHHEIIVSVKDQQMLLKTDGKPEAFYTVSTSRYGIGDRLGSYTTPIGKFFVRMKIGMGQPLGEVFRSRAPTGEVLPPNTPARDPIVTRILWLEGMEPSNQNAFSRCIYIHGTPQEQLLGHPVSFGCIRMRSADVAALCDRIETGATVRIIPDRLPFHEPFSIKKCLAFITAPPSFSPDHSLASGSNAHGLVASHSSTPESAGQQEAE